MWGLDESHLKRSSLYRESSIIDFLELIPPIAVGTYTDGELDNQNI